MSGDSSLNTTKNIPLTYQLLFHVHKLIFAVLSHTRQLLPLLYLVGQLFLILSLGHHLFLSRPNLSPYPFGSHPEELQRAKQIMLHHECWADTKCWSPGGEWLGRGRANARVCCRIEPHEPWEKPEQVWAWALYQADAKASTWVTGPVRIHTPVTQLARKPTPSRSATLLARGQEHPLLLTATAQGRIPRIQSKPAVHPPCLPNTES